MENLSIYTQKASFRIGKYPYKLVDFYRTFVQITCRIHEKLLNCHYQ
jgi:hypothetical protein